MGFPEVPLTRTPSEPLGQLQQYLPGSSAPADLGQSIAYLSSLLGPSGLPQQTHTQLQGCLLGQAQHQQRALQNQEFSSSLDGQWGV